MPYKNHLRCFENHSRPGENHSRCFENHLQIEKFKEDYKSFVSFKNLLEICNQVRVMLWINALYSADAAYGDALELYAGSRRSAFSRLKAFESVYRDLFPFFKKTRRAGASPTQEEVMRDAKAMLRGKRDGKVAIENTSPKVTAGRREVVDEAGGVESGKWKVGSGKWNFSL